MQLKHKGLLGIKTILKNIQKNYQYVSDPEGLDIPQYPTTTVDLQTGDCEDFAFLMGSMLELNNYTWNIADCGSHLALYIYYNRKWVLIDPMGSKYLGHLPKSWEYKCIRILRE